MELLLIILAGALITGARARNRDVLTPTVVLTLVLGVVALAYLSQRAL
jgi:hypothetical protein